MSVWSLRIANASREDYNQLLYDATAMAEPQDVEKLLSLGAMIISMNKMKETAVHLAAKNGMDAKLELLTSVIATVDLKDRKKHTPSYYAAVKGHKQCLITLLNHPNWEPESGLAKALEKVIRKKQSEIVKTILHHFITKYGTGKCDDLGELMKPAVENVDKDTISVFLEEGFSINGGAFCEGTRHSGSSTESCTTYQNEPNYTCAENQFKGYESNPIITAVKLNDLSFVQWLEEKGAKLDIPILKDPSGRSPKAISLVEYARQLGRSEIADYVEKKLAIQTC